MKFKIGLILLLFFFKITAQEKPKRKFNYKATYQLEYQEDSTDQNSIKSETVVLYLGEGISRYSSLGKAVKDSLENMPNPKRMRMDEYNKMTDFKYKIFKNYQNNELVLAEKIFQYDLKYKQDLKQIDWEIQPEKKEILGFSVQKATGSFAARNYIAWFTPELPFSDGPYKFNGLPGLIVEISDQKNDYHFTLTGFQELEKPVSILLDLDSYKTVSQEELDQVRDDYNRDPIGTMEKAGIVFGWSEEDEAKQKKELTKKYKRRNNPIELQ
ncbi:GLPGLI family protein [Zunongwangia sp. HRR-M8]|uniref:GLPGLI family protein n=1 Tax=Zunongwangia sp. HRR-M8 TaxID=3015170 RepID=UPI0022DE9056|nr:GLPGLI family protein [Zunongwangia sp. HRR-M8]WBL22877.1 GLPGLI family protein [Zunongwangia sp. HRR-M8]